MPTARHPETPRCPNQRRIWPQTAQGGLGMPSDALAAPQMPPIREIRPRGGTQKSVEGRWTHHVRCFFVPLTHRPDVCGWFGRWGRLGLRHQGGPLVSGRFFFQDRRTTRSEFLAAGSVALHRRRTTFWPHDAQQRQTRYYPRPQLEKRLQLGTSLQRPPCPRPSPSRSTIWLCTSR